MMSFLREVDIIEDEINNWFRADLLRVESEPDRMFKCDDWVVIYRCEGGTFWSTKPQEFIFKVHICDWSNSITIELAQARSDEGEKKDISRLSITLPDPVKPEGVEKGYENLIRKFLKPYSNLY